MIHLPAIRHGVCIIAFFVAATGSVHAATHDNAALSRFADSITFYADFNDAELAASMARGEAVPVRVRGEPRFEDGFFGRALLLGKGTDAVISYALRDNVDFTRPGTLSFWVCPVGWDREQIGRRPFFSINAAGNASLQFLRWGSMIGRNQDRLRDAFFLFILNFRDMQAPYPRSGVSGLNDGMWHCVVITWDDDAISLYVDGVVSQRSEWSRPFDARDFPPEADLTLDLGGAGIDNTLLDAFTVYDRRLSDDEIREIFQLGLGIEFILEENFAVMPAQARRGDEDAVRLVGGRLSGEQGVWVGQGGKLQWRLSGDEPYFIEFWLKAEGWDGLSEAPEPVCRFLAGDIEYRLYKPRGQSDLVLERADGKVLYRYPIYRWRKPAWMRRGDEMILWHYIQIASVRGRIHLSIDGFDTESTAGVAPGGPLRALELDGQTGNVFTELRVVKGMLDYDNLRARYRHLYRGQPLELLRVAVEESESTGDDMDYID